MQVFISSRTVPAMHSWLIRDTPPKPQAPVSRLAANNNLEYFAAPKAAAADETSCPSNVPRRFASIPRSKTLASNLRIRADSV